MLHLFFAVAFSAVPLTMYIPPIRSLNVFVEIIEDVWKESSAHTLRPAPICLTAAAIRFMARHHTTSRSTAPKGVVIEPFQTQTHSAVHRLSVDFRSLIAVAEGRRRRRRCQQTSITTAA
ncbi:hypothetical protein MIMGU_mgv11b020379mg [Erythranthe guttata]|uniref:Secreted protein n=1 Tax=Erythranthe guttata TaxID=4155 RepID=A0A022QHK7_ERYGU|nr:hypothetical protein MIMGU_mgv11b020379mg [Erythranthe guttata]